MNDRPIGSRYSAGDLNAMAALVPFSEAYLDDRHRIPPDCYVVGVDRSLSEHMRHNVFDVIGNRSHQRVYAAPCLLPINILERLFYWREYLTLLEFLDTQGLYAVTYFRNSPFHLTTYGTVYVCEVRLFFNPEHS